MTTKHLLQALILAGLGAAAGMALAADRPDQGRREFMNSCASCHGGDGKGSGPLSASLKTPPADLTLLSQRNGGVFPTQRVQQIIDGRADVKAHGGREMPVWGQRFENQGRSGADYIDMPFNADAYVAARILLLTDYLDRIQVKP